MSPHVSVRPAAWRAVAVTAALGAALLASGCVETTPAPVRAAAADPQARVAPVGYRPVLGTYAGARPAEPAPWTTAPKTEGAR